MQASVARCLRTPPYAARRKGLSFGLVTAYAATATGARLSFATVRFGPITVVPHRDKANSFRRSSILFRPHDPQMKDDWWSRRVPPPGPIRLLRARLSPYSRFRDTPEVSASHPDFKVADPVRRRAKRRARRGAPGWQRGKNPSRTRGQASGRFSASRAAAMVNSTPKNAAFLRIGPSATMDVSRPSAAPPQAKPTIA